VLLAYTNRFLAVAALIRKLAAQYKDDHNENVADQIKSLKLRVRLIRDMQMLSILALLLSVVCMFSLFIGEIVLAKYVFSASLLSLMISLGMSLREIMISTHALAIQLKDMGDDLKL
jgi:hypothetical protein